MKSYVIIVFSVFYILGVIAFFTNNIVFFSALLLGFLILAVIKDWVTNKTAVLYYLIFGIALLNCHFQIKNFDGLSEFIPLKGTVTGVVETIPTTSISGRTKFYLKVKSFAPDKKETVKIDAKTIVTLNDSSEKLNKIKIGDSVEIEGKLRSPIRAKNPSQFDYANYLKNHKTFSTFSSKNQEWKIVSGPTSLSGKFLQKLNDKRNGILEVHKRYLKSPNIEVLGGVVFGDDAINPPNDIKASFINSGLLHILAASGMNVTIIFGLWFFIGSRLKIDYRLNILIGAILVAFYTLMTGMGPSVLRAAIMIEFILLGKMINRKADTISLVFFVAFLMLLYNPAMICDIGFQMSFVATFALMYFCPPVLENIKNKFWEFWAGAVLIPIVAQFWVAPIQMFYFNNFATYSILANFAIALFIMAISFLGFFASVLAMIPIPIFADKVCMVFDFILNPIISGLVNISHYFAGLPHSLLTTIHPNALQMGLYYLILMVIGYGIRHGFKNRKLIAAIVLAVMVFAFSFVKMPDKNCEVLVFDVGNADSFLIKTPENKYIMIDTGRGAYTQGAFSLASAVQNKYMKDNGITSLDLLILTHFDFDHSGGAIDIMEAVDVKKVIINRDLDDSKTTNKIMSYLKKRKINYAFAVNDKPEISENNLTVKTFTPDFKTDKNDNDNSIITLLTYGDFDMLFMGDGGLRSFNEIKKNLPENVEVLKVGHHGARKTVNNKMIRTLQPDAAVISTGFNAYGHPAKNTLGTLFENKLKVYRTDVNNAIKIESDGRKYAVLKYNTTERTFEKDLELPCRHVSDIIKKN